MNKLKVYLDMDGVIADFHSKYVEIKGNSEWCDIKFHQLVEDHRIFRNLNWMPRGQLLANTLLSWRELGMIDLEILSSCGTWNVRFAPKSAEQKTHWLNERGFANVKKNFVHSFACKKRFATPDSVMIDDRHDVVDGFNSAGGIGLLYTDEGYISTMQHLATLISERHKHANIHLHQ